MSRLTAAQVITLGEYLQPDFEPSSLTVAQLLGIFGYHNINYPSQYTKTKLVQLFNDEIKQKREKLSQQRIKRTNSVASDDGITDGLTGRPIGETQVRGPIIVMQNQSLIRERDTSSPSEDLQDAFLEHPLRLVRKSRKNPTLYAHVSSKFHTHLLMHVIYLF